MPWSRSSSPSRHSEVIRPPRSGRISISHRPPAIFIAAMLAAAGCGASTPLVKSSSVDTSPTSPATSPAPTPAPREHVFVIVMENRSASQALQGSYTAQLAATYGAATNYHGVGHPSLPNYLALTSGST